jgi:hypothetical protein
MKDPYLIAFLKILSGILAVLFAAAAKWVKEWFERRSQEKGIKKNMLTFAPTKRLLYQNDPVGFMKENHPQTVFFTKEVLTNAFRPVFILMLVSIFSYHSDIFYLIFAAIIFLSYFFIELTLDEIRDKNWYKLLLVVIWVLSFSVIVHSELLLQQKTSCSQVTANTTENQTQSEITCPKCGHKKMETLPTDVCLIKYTCEQCHADLFPKEGDCCVFCSYGTNKCPSKQ